jgi:NAD(P)-dependent dehydrogenase (short-subunit alcohol dehydrogenase family)
MSTEDQSPTQDGSGSDLFSLNGRVVLVTGSGQGVGAEIASTLARAGAAVAVNDIDGDRVERVVGEIVETGGRAVAAIADVTDAAAVGDMVASIEAGLGPVDVLVNNAGIPPDGVRAGLFLDSDPSTWARFVDLNFYGVLHLTHRVAPGMVERGWGRVITIVSDAARTGEPKIAVYSAAKAAAAAFSRSLAKEVGRNGVTCNCISLGSIASPHRDADDIERASRVYPMKRLGQPTDVAPLVLYLASDAAGWVTAQTYAVDGGYAPS